MAEQIFSSPCLSNLSSIKSRIILVLLVVVAVLLIFVLKAPITGEVVAKVNVIGNVRGLTCDIDLIDGWNLFSIPCVLNDTNLYYFLANQVGSTYSSVHIFDPTNNSDRWKSYNPDLPEWVEQDLSVIGNQKAYWILMDADENIYHSSNVTIPSAVVMQEGWNLVGMRYNTTLETDDAFELIDGVLDSAYMYNSTEESWWRFVNDNPGMSNLTHIYPTYGYWINVSEDVVWWIT